MEGEGKVLGVEAATVKLGVTVGEGRAEALGDGVGMTMVISLVVGKVALEFGVNQDHINCPVAAQSNST